MRKLCEAIWTADRMLNLGGIKLPIRMTVIRLRDGGLLLHSPVKLDAETRKALDSIGPTRYLVAPNKVHHLFVADYLKAYPDARSLACPGLPEKRSKLRFHEVLSDDPPAGWAGEIEQRVFGGIPFLQEVDFFHITTRTLILTDIVFNAGHSDSLLTRTFLRLNGTYQKFGPSRLVKLMMRDKAAARASVDRILGWDFDRVVMAHGDVIEAGGRQALKDAFAWLTPG